MCSLAHRRHLLEPAIGGAQATAARRAWAAWAAVPTAAKMSQQTLTEAVPDNLETNLFIYEDSHKILYGGGQVIYIYL